MANLNFDFKTGSYIINNNVPVFVPSFWNYEFRGTLENPVNQYSRNDGGLIVPLYNGDGTTSFSQRFEIKNHQEYVGFSVKYRYEGKDFTLPHEYSFKIILDDEILNNNINSETGLEDYHLSKRNQTCVRNFFKMLSQGQHKIEIDIETTPGNTGNLIIKEVKVN